MDRLNFGDYEYLTQTPSSEGCRRNPGPYYFIFDVALMKGIRIICVIEIMNLLTRSGSGYPLTQQQHLNDKQSMGNVDPLYC